MMKLARRFAVSNANMTLVFAVFMALVLNISVYFDLYKILTRLGQYNIGFVISIPIFFVLAFNLIFNLFNWPFLTKPLFLIILLISSIASYAEFNYGVMFDLDMIRNLFETDSSEASSYFSRYSLLWVLITGIIPAWLLIIWPIKKEKLIIFGMKKMLYMVASMVGILVIAFFFYQDYSSVVRNNKFVQQRIVPTAWIHNTYRYLDREYFSEPIPYRKIGEDAHQSTRALVQTQSKPTLLVFLVGETARAQNYPFNGYARPTTPYSEKQKLFNFQNVASCGTATAVSVPCMFSVMNRDKFKRDVADRQDNALDIMQRAQISVLWEENDGGDKKVAKGVNKVTLSRDSSEPNCNGRSCYDIALLDHFDQTIAQMQGNRAIFLHMMGSHGPTYFERYPRSMAYFMPDCERADIENCSVEQIVNTYDNTIRYTDYVFDQTIERLKKLQDKYNVGVIYISDHGESLGKNGLFLHGTPYTFAPAFQTEVPLMMWFSDGFIAAKNIDASCLEQETAQAGHSQDNIFDSLLGIMDVNTSAYRPAQDLFAQCRRGVKLAKQ